MFSKTKRYAYYFDGVNAYAHLTTQWVFAGDGYNDHNWFGGMYRLIHEMALEYEMLKQSPLSWNRIMSPGLAFNPNNTFMLSGRLPPSVSAKVWTINGITQDGRHTLKLHVEDNLSKVYFDGTYVASRTDGHIYRVLDLGGPEVPDNTNRRWHGYIYGIALDGESIDLQDIPGIKFHNVVRYELDRNGNIIESTATTLNDI